MHNMVNNVLGLCYGNLTFLSPNFLCYFHLGFRYVPAYSKCSKQLQLRSWKLENENNEEFVR
jgi:hypothetical protein